MTLELVSYLPFSFFRLTGPGKQVGFLNTKRLTCISVHGLLVGHAKHKSHWQYHLYKPSKQQVARYALQYIHLGPRGRPNWEIQILLWSTQTSIQEFTKWKRYRCEKWCHSKPGFWFLKDLIAKWHEMFPLSSSLTDYFNRRIRRCTLAENMCTSHSCSA